LSAVEGLLRNKIPDLCYTPWIPVLRLGSPVLVALAQAGQAFAGMFMYLRRTLDYENRAGRTLFRGNDDCSLTPSFRASTARPGIQEFRQVDGVLVRPPGAFLIRAEKFVPLGLLGKIERCIKRRDISLWKVNGNSM
jgi:hypothetical protein